MRLAPIRVKSDACHVLRGGGHTRVKGVRMQPQDEREARFQHLFVAHQRAVIAYVARRTQPPGDLATAEDIASVVFMTAWRRLDAVGPDPLPWLLVTAKNVMADNRRGQDRRAGREGRHARDRTLTALTSADPADSVTDAIAVRVALAQLSERDRELAILVAWDDLTIAQAAQVLGIKPDAARARWKRLRERLASALADPSEPVRHHTLSRDHGGSPLTDLAMET
ncbi:unannotated protein [freshwater metagenome]|uniref:Unannotated protein n=1 Tax=freshwater metagenome TaxID=449393 RepID=A0A6J7J2N4_9ZZZZ